MDGINILDTAYCHWLRANSNNNVERCAKLIHESGPGELAWELLAATGDATYDWETFRKAARMVLRCQIDTQGRSK